MVVLPTPPFWLATAMRIISSPSPLSRRRCTNSASVTLCSTWNAPCHACCASTSSAAAPRPFGSTQTVLVVDRCADIFKQFGELCHGAGGDYVVLPLSAFGLAGTTVAFSPSDSHTLWRNSARRRRGSISVTGPSTMQATTTPGSPAPDPTSDPGGARRGSKRTNCAELRMWRSQRWSSVEADTRFWRPFSSFNSAA